MSYEEQFITALGATLAIELPLLWLGLRLLRAPIALRHALTVGSVASGLTLPYLWFVFPNFVPERTAFVLFGELAVVLIEAGIYWRLLPVSFRSGLFIAFIANLASALVGLWLLPSIL